MIKVSRIVNDEIICYCPFHDDKNASLSVNLPKNVAYCFAGCYSGDAIGLIAKAEGVNRLIARMLIESGEAFSITDYDFEFHKFPSLENNGHTISAVGNKYLHNRGFADETILNWGMEYNGIDGYIRIPAKDREGKMVGYIHRMLNGQTPKYVYSKGFPKKSTLFGIDKVGVGTFISVVLVEGSLDCIWLHQNNFPNTLAILGDDLSDEQVEILRDYWHIQLCFDSDYAGVKATERAIKKLSKDFKVSVVALPNGYKDIQEVLSEDIFSVMMKGEAWK